MVLKRAYLCLEGYYLPYRSTRFVIICGRGFLQVGNMRHEAPYHDYLGSIHEDVTVCRGSA